MPHTTEDPEFGEVKKDPRDTLIEAQREWIEWAINTLNYWGVTRLDKKEGRELQDKIQAAEKAIKGG